MRAALERGTTEREAMARPGDSPAHHAGVLVTHFRPQVNGRTQCGQPSHRRADRNGRRTGELWCWRRGGAATVPTTLGQGHSREYG